jgi:hypothetical protein
MPDNSRFPIGKPFQAPPLTANFVERLEVSRELKHRLLAEQSPSAGVFLISAIHGLGGIGKTTLASALAHDADVQNRFYDGILWATLGEEPDLISLLGGWVEALGDYNFRPTSVGATSAHLRTLLGDKALLLVVDDAWEPEHVTPFLVANYRSQVLVMSRRADVAGAGAGVHQLQLMTPEESLALLENSTHRQLEGEEKEAALRVAETAGYLPVALNLVAARVNRGVVWDELEEACKQELRGSKS